MYIKTGNRFLETGYRYRYRCDVIIAAVQRTYAYAISDVTFQLL